MIGLIIVVAFAVYWVISCGVVWLVIRWARKTGRGVKRWAAAAILAMYLLVFWDQVPTLVLHKYYCATKAGFWVYKTPEQWKTENPGVAETLTWKDIPYQYKNSDGSFGFQLNERFIDETRQWKAQLFPVIVSTDSIIDVKTGDVVVKRVRVGSGYHKGSFYKFWVGTESCLPGQEQFRELAMDFEKLNGRDK